MGGRGADSGKGKKSGGGGVKVEAIQTEAKQQEKTKSFLFNRIDEIKKFGDREYKLKNVPRGAKGFLTMFQKNAAKLGSTFGLNEEFVITEKYLILQQIRYGDMLSFEFETDENAGECMVPALILQPIVENAIFQQ